jgi:hypothetical protein
MSDVVFIEGLTGDLYIKDSADVEVYNATFRALTSLAAEPDETRRMISQMITRYAAQC